MLDKTLWNRPDLNADFTERAESSAADRDWLPTRSSGANIQPIESVGSLSVPRLTALLRLQPAATYQLHHHRSGAELLVLEGSIDNIGELFCGADSPQSHTAGFYLRYPVGSGIKPVSSEGCTVFIKLGQIAEDDTECRVIDSTSSEDWLPGPVKGTEVLALHMHGSKCAMLIRWLETAYFKPKLDPQGEEIFVVSGTLFDDRKAYESGTWIRNPVVAWQSWGGYAGTVVYYKNGHFPDQSA